MVLPIRSSPHVVLALLVATGLPAQPPANRAPLAPAFAPITQSVARELSGDRALRTVAFVEQFFRLPGLGFA